MRPILTRTAVWGTLALLLIVAAAGGHPASAQERKLTQQRDEKIAALLTPEQHKKIAELRAASKANSEHGKPADDEKKPVEKKSSKAEAHDRSTNPGTK